MGMVDEFKAQCVAHVFTSLGWEHGGGGHWATCSAVALVNTTLSGTQTIDGVSSVNGNIYFMANQTDPTQVGLWVAAAGAWTRSAVQYFNGLRVVPLLGTQAGITWYLSKAPKKIADIVFGTSVFAAAVAPSNVFVLSGQRRSNRLHSVDTSAGPLTLFMPVDVLYEGMEHRFVDAAPATSWGSNSLTVNGNGLLINNSTSLVMNSGTRTDITLRHNGASYTVRGV